MFSKNRILALLGAVLLVSLPVQAKVRPPVGPYVNGQMQPIAGAHKEETKKGFSSKPAKAKCTDCHENDKPEEAPPYGICLTCHKSYEALAEKSSKLDPNPHDNHYILDSEPDCDECHMGHKVREPICVDCHEGMVFEKK
ncbi:cytochrome c3 family protein [Consotaella aegiceratis]|uniref:cytochrome c3 family protein n=1 Tax=Consotaella aegiceratis TaxID=3097961 RepID=UPI002F3ED6CA